MLMVILAHTSKLDTGMSFIWQEKMFLICILRIRGEPMFETTEPQMEEDYIVVRGLKPGESYEMQVVAADGNHLSESKTQEVETYSDGNSSFPYYIHGHAILQFFPTMLRALKMAVHRDAL
jgi:hypothetical protein